MAKRDQATLIGGHGDLNRQGPEVKLRAGTLSCSNCGSSSHRARDASCRVLVMICWGCQMKGHMAAYCRRSHLFHNLKKSQEVSNIPKKTYTPSEARRLKTGKSKLAELKDQDTHEKATTEYVDFMTIITAEVVHHVHDRERDV